MPRLEQRRSRSAGSYTTSEVAAPARGQDQATIYRVTFDLDPSDLADPSLVMDVILEGSIDGTTWREFARGDGWVGGTIGRDGNVSPPRLSWMSSDNRALTKVRVTWRQSKLASVGVTLENEAVDVSSSRINGNR